MSIHSDLKTFKSKLQSVNLTLPPLNKVTEEMMGVSNTENRIQGPSYVIAFSIRHFLLPVNGKTVKNE